MFQFDKDWALFYMCKNWGRDNDAKVVFNARLREVTGFNPGHIAS